MNLQINNHCKSSLSEIFLKNCKPSARLKYVLFNSFSEKLQQLGNWKRNRLEPSFRRGLYILTNFLKRV